MPNTNDGCVFRTGMGTLPDPCEMLKSGESVMKKVVASFFLILGLIAGKAHGGDVQEAENMKIKLSFEGNEVIVRMEDNLAVRQIVEMLPADFEFSDFAGEEKIATFPRPVSLAGVSRGMIAKAGRMFIYAPWGNMGIFYKDHGDRLDQNLIALGTVEKGLEHLKSRKNGFFARLEKTAD